VTAQSVFCPYLGSYKKRSKKLLVVGLGIVIGLLGRFATLDLLTL
jgi:hypothetical protein